MNLWAVTMVRDELDILPYTLAHLASEGVDGIIVADNRSTDGTWEWLQDAKLSCELEVLRDNEIGYYQSRKMTHLARKAFGHGADWVIPFDADELWHNPRGPTLHASLDVVVPVQGALHVELYNYFPTSADDDNPNPFERIVHRDPNPARLPKVIVSENRTLTIMQGNHGATGTEPFPQQTVRLRVAHFPWRSPEQFLRKIRNGSEAYKATDLPHDTGEHWRNYGELLDQSGPDAVIDLYNEWFFDPPQELVHCPVPWRRYR